MAGLLLLCFSLIHFAMQTTGTWHKDLAALQIDDWCTGNLLNCALTSSIGDLGVLVLGHVEQAVSADDLRPRSRSQAVQPSPLRPSSSVLHAWVSSGTSFLTISVNLYSAHCMH